VRAWSVRAEGEVVRFPSQDVGAKARFDTFFAEEHERPFKASIHDAADMSRAGGTGTLARSARRTSSTPAATTGVAGANSGPNTSRRLAPSTRLAVPTQTTHSNGEPARTASP